MKVKKVDERDNTCPACDGEKVVETMPRYGKYRKAKCWLCNGVGRVTRAELKKYRDNAI